MANAFVTVGAIARLALENLYERTIAAQLVTRDYDDDFVGGVGDTVTIRKPAIFTANTFDRATGIVIQDASENSTTVKLDTMLDVSFAVTAEQWALNVVDFNRQLIVPAIEALAQGVDKAILALLAGTGVTDSVTLGTDPKNMLDATKILNDHKVPPDGRYGVLTTAQEAAMLKDPLFSQYLQRGDTEGLINASVGHKFGVDWFRSTNLPGAVGAVFHRTAVALVTRTLQRPAGVPAAATAVVNRDGFGLRVVNAYDVTKKQDVVSLDCLIGTKILDANRAVKLA